MKIFHKEDVKGYRLLNCILNEHKERIWQMGMEISLVKEKAGVEKEKFFQSA